MPILELYGARSSVDRFFFEPRLGPLELMKQLIERGAALRRLPANFCGNITPACWTVNAEEVAPIHVSVGADGESASLSHIATQFAPDTRITTLNETQEQLVAERTINLPGDGTIFELELISACQSYGQIGGMIMRLVQADAEQVENMYRKQINAIVAQIS